MRVKNADMLGAQISKALSARPVAEWMRIFEKANVPCSPINDIAQLFDDPHVRAREMKIELDHPLTGKLPNIANPMRLSRSAVQYHRPPPTLGEHTNEVLDELLDLSAEEISNLAAKGVI
jgi:crotonobetainyl-CoA:carnitine CoA-transferase CaiB-like acyl-CoA transferase